VLRILQGHRISSETISACHSRALGVLVRSIIVEREPIYRQQQTVQIFASGMFGAATEEMERLGDDRIQSSGSHAHGDPKFWPKSRSSLRCSRLAAD